MAKSIQSRILKQYRDIDLDMTIHPLTDDLTQVSNVDAINKSIRNILKTNRGERVFQPQFGSTIWSSLFEPLHPVIAINLKDQIANAIMLYEPRVDIIEIEVKPDYDMNAYDVFIHYTPKNERRMEVLEIFLKRLR
jgi:phage baseplate assembly protein W